MIYVGIDPGLSGAVAVINEDFVINLYDCPTLKVGKKNEPDTLGMSRILERVAFTRAGLVVGIERVHSMPDQGVASTFKFGMGFGVWLGILASLKLSHELITPQAWKKVMMSGMPKEKDASRQRALQLFPASADDLRLKKHHGRADALLIAEYMRRTHGGGTR